MRLTSIHKETTSAVLSVTGEKNVEHSDSRTLDIVMIGIRISKLTVSIIRFSFF